MGLHLFRNQSIRKKGHPYEQLYDKQMINYTSSLMHAYYGLNQQQINKQLIKSYRLNKSIEDHQRVTLQIDQEQSKEKFQKLGLQSISDNNSKSYIMYFFQKIQMTKQEIKCFICGQLYCGEDSDHQKMSFDQFNSFMEEKAGFYIQIANLKAKVKRVFQKLENHGKVEMSTEAANLCLLIDKLHFWHLLEFLPTLKDVEAAIFGFMLTKAQIIRLICLLMNNRRNYELFPAFPELFAEVHKFKKNIRKTIENQSYGSLIQKFAQIIQRQQQETRKKKYESKYPGGPETVQIQNFHSQMVEIEGIPFSCQRTSLDLSVLHVDDRLLCKILPSLQKMKNLRQFHLRNNSISLKGYKMLLNALPNIQSADFSNSNSDFFLHMLPEKLPNLKALYLNEAHVNSYEKIDILTNNFLDLKVLILHSNGITFEMIKNLIHRKPTLFYVSLKNNPIDYNQAQAFQNKFFQRGGYFEI